MFSFRKTQASLYTREGMHYGFIRSYIDINQADRVLQILKLKVNFDFFFIIELSDPLGILFLRRNRIFTNLKFLFKKKEQNPWFGPDRHTFYKNKLKIK